MLPRHERLPADRAAGLGPAASVAANPGVDRRGLPLSSGATRSPSERRGRSGSSHSDQRAGPHRQGQRRPVAECCLSALNPAGHRRPFHGSRRRDSHRATARHPHRPALCPSPDARRLRQHRRHHQQQQRQPRHQLRQHQQSRRLCRDADVHGVLGSVSPHWRRARAAGGGADAAAQPGAGDAPRARGRGGGRRAAPQGPEAVRGGAEAQRGSGAAAQGSAGAAAQGSAGARGAGAARGQGAGRRARGPAARPQAAGTGHPQHRAQWRARHHGRGRPAGPRPVHLPAEQHPAAATALGLGRHPARAQNMQGLADKAGRLPQELEPALVCPQHPHPLADLLRRPDRAQREGLHRPRSHHRGHGARRRRPEGPDLCLCRRHRQARLPVPRALGRPPQGLDGPVQRRHLRE
eukprot:m.48601 g.48601  ORF g.48601 m.48601 type:complete len:408 (+) comp12740_c0_seq2:392-1615(+)